MQRSFARSLPCSVLLSLLGSTAAAQDADEIAKQLSNPIASLTSVPGTGRQQGLGDVRGADQWRAGPTAVALRQTASGWTYGGLINHVESLGKSRGSHRGRRVDLPLSLRGKS
jgi:hypothetical protein